jgi:hypothetical protein
MFKYKGSTGKRANGLWFITFFDGKMERATSLTFALLLCDLAAL